MRGAAVGIACGEALFDLVDPQYARRDGRRLPSDSRIFRSVSPTYLSKSGRSPAGGAAREDPAQAPAARLLPQPCTPSSMMPLGGSSCGAEPSKPARRFCSHAFEFGRSADIRELSGVMLVAQNAVVVQHFVLGAHHLRDIRDLQRAI